MDFFGRKGYAIVSVNTNRLRWHLIVFDIFRQQFNRIFCLQSAFSMITDPSDTTYRILIVDDDIGQADMLREFLRISGYSQIEHVADIRSMWRKLKSSAADDAQTISTPYDIILLDYMLPDGTGLDVLGQMAERGVRAPVIMVTGQGSERIAAQAIQSGAADYLIKAGDYLMTLPTLINKTIHAHQLKLAMQQSLDKIRYQAVLLNNVRDAVVVWNNSGVITYWNRAATALFGWNAEERLGLSVEAFYISMFTPPITLPEGGISHSGKEGSGQHVIRRLRNKAGKTIWISSHVTALREAEDEGSNGGWLGFMDVSHDITRNVEGEQALRESEARYRAIVEDYQTELICRFRPNGVITFANEVYCRYFDKPRDELVGMNFLFFVPETDRSRIIQHLASFGPQKHVAALEHQVRLPNQETRWLQRTDRAIFDTQGRIFEFQTMARDVTDRKKMEAQLQAAQAHLVQAARLVTIGEMAAGVAHQIYNPLTTIIADAQILLRNLPQDASGPHADPMTVKSTVRESAEAIEQAGWRLQQVVQRLMEFSRPSSEAQEELSINQTIQNAVSLVGSQFEETGCNLESELQEALPNVLGNSRQLENLWVYLLLLARDASRAAGAGEQASPAPRRAIRIQSKAGPGNLVLVEVHDNGAPIPPDDLATIFEPNFVGPTSGRGTGMELSICREIVRQHGGQITADSMTTAGSASPDQLAGASPRIVHDTIFRVAIPVVSTKNTVTVKSTVTAKDATQ